MAQYYYKGVETGHVYQFWVGNQGLDSLPPGFTDAFGNVLEIVHDYHATDGTIEDVVMCLPFGMVRLGTKGPNPPGNPYAPGHIFSPWEQDFE
jgi:hypothetical protein